LTPLGEVTAIVHSVREMKGANVVVEDGEFTFF